MRVCVVYSYNVDPSITEQIAAGLHPKVDWLDLPARLKADVIHDGLLERPGRLLIKCLSRLGHRGRWLALAALAWARRDAFDVLVFGNENLALLFLARARLSVTRRKPAVVIINHHLSARWKSRWFRLLRLRRRVQALICLNRFQAEFARRNLGVDPRNIVELPFGACVDGSFFSPRPIEQDAPYILSVGREARDYATLVEALKDIGIPAKLVVSGMGPNAQVGLAPSSNAAVEILRGRSVIELRDLYARAAFVLVPLHDCEYPAGITSIMEAMAMGKAVVTTRSRGIVEFVSDGETGLVARVHDAADLRSKILVLWKSPELARRMGACARQSVANRVDLDAYVRSVSSVVMKVAADGE